VLGAAGGVGLAAIELAKAMGAYVVAAASSQEKIDLCRRYGADDGIIYDRGPLGRDGQKALSSKFKAASGQQGFDVIYDAVGGEYAEPALRAIAWEGRYLVVGFAAGEIPKMPLNLALLKSCDIAGVWWGEWVDRNPQGYRQNNEEIFRLYQQGKINPYISERFALPRGGDAIQHLASRKALGKVIVEVS
jgi:NADPH2:quinone reductase